MSTIDELESIKQRLENELNDVNKKIDFLSFKDQGLDSLKTIWLNALGPHFKKEDSDSLILRVSNNLKRFNYIQFEDIGRHGTVLYMKVISFETDEKYGSQNILLIKGDCIDDDGDEEGWRLVDKHGIYFNTVYLKNYELPEELPEDNDCDNFISCEELGSVFYNSNNEIVMPDENVEVWKIILSMTDLYSDSNLESL